MDSFTERMLERARERQKKLEEHFSNSDENPRLPLQESNVFKKYGKSSQNAKSQTNLTECNKIKRKEVVSDSNLNAKLINGSPKENKSEGNIPRSVMQGCTRVSSEMQCLPESPIKTLNIQKENFNMEIKLTSSDNVRVEVEIEERDEDNDKENGANNKPEDSCDSSGMSDKVKHRLQRLGKLYSGVEDMQLSSPIHRTEAKFHETMSPENQAKKRPVGGLSRLKVLANTVNQWEDEIATGNKVPIKKESQKKSWKPPAPKPPNSPNVHTPKKGPAPKPPVNSGSSSPVHARVNVRLPSGEGSPEKKSAASSPTKAGGSETKQLAWDQAVLATLESQGFTRTNSNARLVYDYKKDSQVHNQDSDDSSSDAEGTQPTKLDTVDESEDEEPEQMETPKHSQIAKIASKFERKKEDSTKSQIEKKVTIPKSPSKNEFRSGGVLNKAAMFDQQSPSKAKDPALLSVSERKALFEKNKGTALVPKAPFAMALSVKQMDKNKSSANISVKPASPQKCSPKKPEHSISTGNLNSPQRLAAESGGISSKVKALFEKKNTISQNQISHSIKQQKQKDMDILLNRFNQNKEVTDGESEEESDEENVSETTKMISNQPVKIVQFKEFVKSPIPPPPPAPFLQPQKTSAPKRRSKGDSPKVREVLEDVKRIRVSPPKTGRMYPCLSDIEATTETEPEPESSLHTTPDTSFEDNESYSESDGPNTSFGKDIMDVVCKNKTPLQKRPIYDESTASDLSDVLDDSDDSYLNEALANNDSEDTEGPTPPKHGRSTSNKNLAAPSHSFYYKNISESPMSGKSPKKKVQHGNNSPHKSSDLPTHIVDGENVLPLTHTVSFYRKQQAQSSLTPVKQIVRNSPILEEKQSEHNDSKLDSKTAKVQKKIEELLNTVAKQQTVISQASQALNLCCATIEFSGSSEQVEAEKLLLVAAQRRQAALYEVQRLKVDGILHHNSSVLVEKGNLSISGIKFPLKREYVRALSAAGGQGHHVMCLVRYAEQVVPTRLVSTVASPKDCPEMELCIPGSVMLQNIYSDFTVTLEVYCLQAHEEILPHNVKYHINFKKGNSKLTPKKHKDSKLVMPTISSPAGPQAVRSSSFELMGYVIFSLQGIQRTHWTLNNAPAMSPLEGSVNMRITCELVVSVEHRGFLTMFEDVSGFGAWHRRWCLLKGQNLCYWKYPDDEKKKAPIDSINLQNCSIKQVGPVSRDICARPNTFLLETIRSAKPEDKDSLVTVCQGEKTLIRHLLSADTKEERIEWCEKFNRALSAVKLWKT